MAATPRTLAREHATREIENGTAPPERVSAQPGAREERSAGPSPASPEPGCRAGGGDAARVTAQRGRRHTHPSVKDGPSLSNRPVPALDTRSTSTADPPSTPTSERVRAETLSIARPRGL